MLCDRLVLDVQRGLDAQRAGNLPEAHNQLVHAQEIVIHLRSTLRVEAWDGGPGLASLYDWLHDELVRANVTQGPGAHRGLPLARHRPRRRPGARPRCRPPAAG